MNKSEDKELVEVTARVCYNQYEKYLLLINGKANDVVFDYDETNIVEKEYYEFIVEYFFTNENTCSKKAHNEWVDLMDQNGWTFHPCFNLDNKEHPWVTDFKNLTNEKDQHRPLFIFSQIYSYQETYESIGDQLT